MIKAICKPYEFIAVTHVEFDGHTHTTNTQYSYKMHINEYLYFHRPHMFPGTKLITQNNRRMETASLKMIAIFDRV